MRKFFSLSGHSLGTFRRNEQRISRAQSAQVIKNKAPLARLERATCGLGIRRSIHLSYRGNLCNLTISLVFRQSDFFVTSPKPPHFY
jgi:hypothetical protein